jgi:transcriptional regulator with XRE-family HTH domain
VLKDEPGGAGKEAGMAVRKDPVPVPGVNVLRWELGNALRDRRLAASKTISEVARALECSDAKISRMESGQRGAIARDVRDLCLLYGVPEAEREELVVMAREAREADRLHTSTITAKYSTYVALETTAVTLRNYEATFIPGLLQTEAYARAVVRGLLPQGGFDEQEVEDRVRIRADRQRRLTASFRPLRAYFIVDENVLWRPIGTKSVREAQLAHLAEASRLPNVTLQVMPEETGIYQGMEAASFVLLGFEDGAARSTACYAEGAFTTLFSHSNADIEAVSEKFELMKARALPPVESAALIMRIAGGRHKRGR